MSYTSELQIAVEHIPPAPWKRKSNRRESSSETSAGLLISRHKYVDRKLLQDGLVATGNPVVLGNLRDEVRLEDVGPCTHVRLVHGDLAHALGRPGRELPRREDLPVAEHPQLIVPLRDIERLGQVRVDVDGCGGRGVDREVVGDGLVAVGGGGLGCKAKVLDGVLRVGVGDYGEAGETGVCGTF